MKQLLVQNIKIGGSGGNVNVGGYDIHGPLDSSLQNIGDVVNRLMQFLIPIAAVILFIVLIWGGYDFMMSQGSADKIKSGQAKLTAGMIGFILLIASYVIVRVISQIFGIGEGLF